MENRSRGITFVWMALAAIIMIAINNAVPVEIPDVSLLPETNMGSGQWYMEQVMPWPDFISPSSNIAYTPGPDTEMFWEPHEMPPLPDCDDLGFDDCHWETHYMESRSGDMVQVELKSSDGKVIGRAELIRLDTASQEGWEISRLYNMGYKHAWIARIEVMNVFRGNGLGTIGGSSRVNGITEPASAACADCRAVQNPTNGKRRDPPSDRAGQSPAGGRPRHPLPSSPRRW